MLGKDIASRMREVRASTGMGREKFAQMVGCGKSSWQKYEEDQAVPGANVLKSLCDQGFSADWILTGQGEMLLRNSEENSALPFNMPLLNEIITEVDILLENKKHKISNTKRSKLYGLLYEEIMGTRLENEAEGKEIEESLDLEKIARFVELAV